MSQEFKYLSKLTPRVDALERVTGQAKYTEDVALPGMLYARVLRSPHPHAKVKSIDTTAALAHPGVRAVLHSKNTDTKWTSGDQYGRRRVFSDTVRYVGEPVAVVAAVDRHSAEEALRLIRVDYEQLPHVLTVDQALKEGAPKIHPEGNLDKEVQGGAQTGNVEEGLRQADFVYENDFITKHLNNAQLERRVSLAQWEGDHLTVWASTQGIYNCRGDIARDLKVPLSQVRVICQYMGGGFGNKNMGYDFDLMAALLAKETRRPVRVEFSRHEDFIGVHGRWATQQHYRIGYKKDGTLTAIDQKLYSNMGGYLRSTGGAGGARGYVAPNIRTMSYRVHTNTTSGANYRAPAGPQGAFSIESAIDDIAAKLGMDPVEFRLKNTPKGRGGGGPPRPSSAAIKILQDGTVKVFVGVTDIGTGAKTTMGLIAAETLGVPLENILVVSGDTDEVPYSTGESGSSTTSCTGVAVIQAAKQAKDELLKVAAVHQKIRREDLDLRDGRVVNLAKPGQSWTIAESISEGIERFDRASWPDVVDVSVTTAPENARRGPAAPRGAAGEARTAPPGGLPACLKQGAEAIGWAAKRKEYANQTGPVRKGVGLAISGEAAHFAEVEVNMETGKVKVLRYVAAHDCGTIINMLAGVSQVKGGVTQGIGMALREELIWDRQTGTPINNYYHGAKPMIHPEVPDIEAIFIESDNGTGPYGAKPLGEVPIVPVVGTIANAIFHATGARMRELPITPDKLLNAFGKGTGKTAEKA